MKKEELLKLQARNREILATLGQMYDKDGNEKREFTPEEASEEKALKRELEANHREIMMSGDEAAIAALREQQDKSKMLREHFAKVNRREADATTILLNPTSNNTAGNIAASGAVPLSIKELIDTKVEGLELPAT